MTRTLLSPSLPMLKLPTMGRNDLGWPPTVSSSKSNLISPAFCPCALAGKLPVSDSRPMVTARSAFLMSHTSMKRATCPDARADCLRSARWPNRRLAMCQRPSGEDKQRHKAIEPDLGEIAPRLQRIPGIGVWVRNRLPLDTGEAVDQGQDLALTGGAALSLLAVIPINHHPIVV